MGAIGSDAAIETADIALMTDDISKLPWLVRHARHTLAIIRQNIVFSLGVIFIPPARPSREQRPRTAKTDPTRAPPHKKVATVKAAEIGETGKAQRHRTQSGRRELRLSVRGVGDDRQRKPGAQDAHLPSQVTSTRILPCTDFRRRFFELSLWGIVPVSCRQLAVADAGIAPVFTSVALRGCGCCFLISYAEVMPTSRS
jgi:hypothetical protein